MAPAGKEIGIAPGVARDTDIGEKLRRLSDSGRNTGKQVAQAAKREMVMCRRARGAFIGWRRPRGEVAFGQAQHVSAEILARRRHREHQHSPARKGELYVERQARKRSGDRPPALDPQARHFNWRLSH